MRHADAHALKFMTWAGPAALLAATIVAGCSQGETGPAGAAGSTPPAPQDSARTLPIPGADLPLGHPPTDSGNPRALPVTWAVPDGWTAEEPENSVRLAQYRVSGSGGDGECVVFYFGPGQGGDPMANARRWAAQFTQADGSSSESKMLVSNLSSGKLPLHMVEVTGTYDGGMSSQGTSEGYMLLGGIAIGPDAPWFFKFTGPEATVREQRAAFVALLESVEADG